MFVYELSGCGFQSSCSHLDKLDVDKLVTDPVNLNKLSDVVKDDFVKKDKYKAKIKNIEDKILEITKVAANASLNVKINEVRGDIPSISNLAINAALTTIENKTPNVSNLVFVKKTDYNTKSNEREKTITDHNHSKKYTTTPEFNKLTAGEVAARLKQAHLASERDSANFVNRADVDNKLLSFSKIISSNITRHVLVENELN